MCIPKPVVEWLLENSVCFQVNLVTMRELHKKHSLWLLRSFADFCSCTEDRSANTHCLPLMKHGEVWCNMETFTFKVVLRQMCCCCIQHISIGATFTLNVSIQISGLQHTISSFTTFWRGVCECWQTCDCSNMLATKVIAVMFLAHFIPSWAISYTLATVCNLQQSLSPTWSNTHTHNCLC